jgi:hypothetical protein
MLTRTFITVQPKPSLPVLGVRTMDFQTNVGNTNPMAPITKKLTCKENVCYPLSTTSKNELPWKSELRYGPVGLDPPKTPCNLSHTKQTNLCHVKFK